ncbi:hypothetical protein SLS58_006732 [Diplodia intermedia]|uniref:Uncharacterized protein n=1 Tax=Diplodia intermedia TaxID=856260 RepID=A0ABR3TMD3_9PEZI
MPSDSLLHPPSADSSVTDQQTALSRLQPDSQNDHFEFPRSKEVYNLRPITSFGPQTAHGLPDSIFDLSLMDNYFGNSTSAQNESDNNTFEFEDLAFAQLTGSYSPLLSGGIQDNLHLPGMGSLDERMSSTNGSPKLVANMNEHLQNCSQAQPTPFPNCISLETRPDDSDNSDIEPQNMMNLDVRFLRQLTTKHLKR